MEVVVEPDRRLWEEAAQRSDFWPLQQDWDYGLAVRWQAQPVLRLLARDAGGPVAAVQLVGRRWFGLAELWLALRGPVALNGATTVPPKLLAALPRGLLRAVLLAPEIQENAATQKSWLGRRRVYTGHSCAIVDLAPYDRASLRQKWRNRLNAAQARGLRIELADRGKWLDWVIAQYDRVRAAKGFAGPSADFVAQLVRLKSPRQTLAAIALDGREPVAGALFLRHGPDASYYVAASDAQGRAANAANLVLWRGLMALKEQGVRKVDLGTINSDKSPGLARFKLGAGGQPVTLAGTYL
ncbi:MAG: GNAT family N-acetyltransferase [Rhodospirillales bacterium]|jgi:hypothetical protein